MDFDALLAQILQLLQQEKRLSYRALKRRFVLDDEYLEDVKAEIISYVAWPLWLLGYPEQALKQTHEALTLARKLAHPHSLAAALVYLETIADPDELVAGEAGEILALRA